MLTNRERTRVVDAIRGEFGLAACLKAVGLKRSTYYYERGAIAAGDRYAVLRARVAGLFEQGGRAWGYRTIHRMLRLDESDPIVVSEKVVRRIMREGAMRPVYLKRPKRWSSYAGEIGEAPANLVERDFHADAPNMLWVTDVTQFTMDGYKCWLSPVVDCFDGMVVSWTLSRSPNADMANRMLLDAVARSGTGNIQSSIPIKPGLLLSRGTVRGLGGWPCPMWFPGLTFRVMFVLSHLIRTKEFAMGETTVGHVAGEVVRALYGAGYMESTIGHVPQVHQGVGTGTPEARMRCTRVGWARGSPRRPSVSGRAVSAGSGGSITAGWRVCATRICGPVRWTWASGAGAGLRSRWFRVWPWSWSVGRRISPVRDWLRRRWGITVGWRACSSRGWNLMGSCRWMVRMARMCWGSWPGCVRRWSESSMRHAASDLRPLFRWLGRDDLADAIGLAGIRRTHAIAGTLPDDEHRRLLEACASRSVPSRDAAITLLSLTCGLRACDVIGLRIADVDWDSMSIGLVQRKTGNPLTVPMTGPLAARLASWLLDERPATDDDRVFVRYKAPHVALRGHSSVYEAISRVMRHAGLGRRGGSRLLRRNAATRMLEAATPLPTISAVLGHADPDSTRVYMATHRGGMLACVLPVPEGGSS